MDELNITPQPSGDEPEGTSGDPSGDKGAGDEKSSFSLNPEQENSSVPENISDKLLEPSGEEPSGAPEGGAMAGQENPAQLETEPPQESEPAKEKPETAEAEQEPVAETEAPQEQEQGTEESVPEPTAEATEEAPAEKAGEALSLGALASQTEESPSEETPEDEAAPTEGVPEASEKKGLPKGLLIGLGVLAVVAVAGAAMFFTDSWPFKGQVTEVAKRLDTVEEVARPVAQEVCPAGEYYDPAETGGSVQPDLRLLDTVDDSTPPPTDDTFRLLNAIPTARAQRMLEVIGNEAQPEMAPLEVIGNESEPETVPLEVIGNAAPLETATYEAVPYEAAPLETATYETVPYEAAPLETATYEAVPYEAAPLETATYEAVPYEAAPLETATYETAPLETAPLTVNEARTLSTFDPSQCKPIEQNDCDLLAKLKANPDMYYLAPETIASLDGWEQQYCALEELTLTQVPTCGENQVVDADGNCACTEGYFELESTSREITSVLGDETLTLAEPASDSLRTTVLAEASDAILDENGDPVGATDSRTGGSEGGLPINNNLTDTVNPGGLPINSNLTGSDGLEVNRNLSTLGTRTLDGAGRIVCVNCEGLLSQIETLQGRLDELGNLQDITEDQRQTQSNTLQAELDRLEAKADEENCETEELTLRTFETEELTLRTFDEVTCEDLVGRITEIRDVPTATITPEVAQELARLIDQAGEQGCDIPEEEVDECTQYEQEARDQIASGNLAESFNQQGEMILASCLRTYEPCDEKIAYATVAKEYRDASLTDADRNYFEQEFMVRRDAYMDDLSCVPNKQDRCDEISNAGGIEEIPLIPLDEADTREVSDEILTLTEEASPAPGTRSNQPLSGSLLDSNLNPLALTDNVTREASLLSQSNLSAQILANIEQKSILTDEEYFNEYCGGVPYMGEASFPPPEEPPISPAAPPEEPPVAPPVEPPVSPAAPPVEPETGVGAAVSPSAAGFAAPVEPAVPPSDSAEASLAEAEIAAPAQPGEPPVEAGEAAFHGAAPAPTEEPLPPAEITEAPEITQTGPEVYLYFFLLVASQVYFFRRKIYAFIENQ